MTDPEAHQRALRLTEAALSLKALDLVLLDVGSLTHLAEYFLICTGTSDRHAQSIAQRCVELGKEAGDQLLRREGEREGRWVLLDFGDVVIHVFDPPTREHYRLEELWADAPRVAVSAVA